MYQKNQDLSKVVIAIDLVQQVPVSNLLCKMKIDIIVVVNMGSILRC